MPLADGDKFQGTLLNNVFPDRQAGQPALRLAGLPAYRKKHLGTSFRAMFFPIGKNTPKSRKSLRWRFLLAMGAVLAAAIVYGLYYIGVFTNNFRVVSPGKVYRSAQMTEQDIRATISAQGIRTIINLCGGKREPWYRAEVKVAKELGVRHVDIGISAEKLPPPEKLEALLQVFAEGPYPILIHCRAGADRSGLASTIYRVVVEHDRFAAAVRDNLTWRYGHFAKGDAHAMDDFFTLYRRTGKGKDLAQWIVEDYPELYVIRMGVPTPPKASSP